MKNPALTKEFVDSVLDIHSDGTCLWKNVSKFHREKSGTIAGFPKLSNADKRYWVIKIGRVPYKRAYLVFVSATGIWPDLIDHINHEAFVAYQSKRKELFGEYSGL